MFLRFEIRAMDINDMNTVKPAIEKPTDKKLQPST